MQRHVARLQLACLGCPQPALCRSRKACGAAAPALGGDTSPRSGRWRATLGCCAAPVGGKKVSGTCEEIGFVDFRAMTFQWFTVWITGQNSISSHVPDTFSPSFGFNGEDHLGWGSSMNRWLPPGIHYLEAVDSNLIYERGQINGQRHSPASTSLGSAQGW